MNRTNKRLLVGLVIAIPLALLANMTIVPRFDRIFDPKTTYSPGLSVIAVLFAAVLMYLLYRRKG